MFENFLKYEYYMPLFILVEEIMFYLSKKSKNNFDFV
jgi:hypothetical protein